MEHRYGQRHPSDMQVYIRGGNGKLFSAGILSDLSISGGFIRTSLMAEPLSTVVVQFTAPDQAVRAMTARVIRRTPQGLGVEWAEFATELVQIMTRPATESTPVAKAG
jgi:PilZ domain-containing protein